ncbi:HipA domain-containing protein [Janthinobacterium sp. PC23-8]|uniref:HipA domain-containing protein n=1 Tax=Janthinobacterium sp. PC23-8 TaxID=2012679 RepID=UPI000B95E1FB|nr:HipA domain-containing protein [Janthinobacterium sp. PC23-8]OYO31820.1 hypothetical protein CD932_12295 [Janthinobacterium sp. PC23-8]
MSSPVRIRSSQQERTLLASINGLAVGRLMDVEGVWSFIYDPAWLDNAAAFPLSAALSLRQEAHTDTSSMRPVQWYFDNLLPEENARGLLARDANIDISDAFSLLTYYGAESAGSLTLGSAADPEFGGEREERPLPDTELQRRIDNLPGISLVAEAPKRMSMAGAQHKLAVIYRPPALFEPVAATPSTHILKPNHGDTDYRDSVMNELFAMRLARSVGLDVPEVWRHYVPAPVYLIARFDRQAQQGVERLHAIDACQLLNLDRQYKYRAASMESLRQLADACSVPAATRLRLYNWFVFNLLVGNNDAHLKNLSFLVDHAGMRLAPHYDMLSTAVYSTKAMGKDAWPNLPLSWPFQDLERFDQLSRAAVIAAGEELGLAQPTAQRLLDVQLKSVPKAAQAVLHEIEEENHRLLQVQPGLAAVFGSEMRTARNIVGVIIKDMEIKLSVQ